MFWDGTRWVPPQRLAPAGAPRRRLADWLATATMAIVLIALVVPFRGISAVRPDSSAGSGVTAIPAGYDQQVLEESDARLAYTGAWSAERDPAYSGGSAANSSQALATMSLRFSALGVAWIGSAGPSQGRARVFVDGTLVKNVNTRARRFDPSRVLYTITWAAVAERTIRIEVVGSRDRPTVMIDSIIVFSRQAGDADPPAAVPSASSLPTAAPTTAPTNPPVDPTAAPPQPTPEPTPRPTADPTPRPTPEPTPRPTPDPTPTPTSGGIALPNSIDATGSSDASGALASFIASVPNGSTIVFKAGGTYRLDIGLRILGRRNLTFEGNGATLKATATTGQPRTSPFLLEGSSGITIRNFTLVGSNPDGGTSSSHHLDRQDQGGVNVYGGTGNLIENTTIRKTWGDCVYIGMNAGVWADDVTYRDSVCELNGRMGVAITAAQNVVVARVSFDRIAMYPFDIEPDSSAGGGVNVTFKDNTIGSYNHAAGWTPYFFAASGAAGSDVRDVLVTRNRVTGGAGLKVVVGVAARRAIVITDNVSTVTRSGTMMEFYNTQGVTVTGNTQPLSSGKLVYTENCTNVVVSGNTT